MLYQYSPILTYFNEHINCIPSILNKYKSKFKLESTLSGYKCTNILL